MPYIGSISLLLLSVLMMLVGLSAFASSGGTSHLFNTVGLYCFFGSWIPALVAMFVLVRFAKWRFRLPARMAAAFAFSVGFLFVTLVIFFAFAQSEYGHGLSMSFERWVRA
jgi:hypothetical protein